MLRFLHLGDVHFGSNWRGIAPTQRALRDQDLLAAFDQALNLAIQERVDVIMIAGDLFDDALPEYGLVQEVKYRFAQLSTECGPRVLIAPGNHDPWIEGSPYNEPWPSSVHIFNEHWDRVEVAGHSVMGFGFERHGLRTCPVPQHLASAPDLLVMHADWQAGTNSNYCPLQPEQLRTIGARYTALGHIHKAGMVWEQAGASAAYCGSLEPQGFDEPGAHGVWLGTLGSELELDFIPLAQREVKVFTINVEQCQAREEYMHLVLKHIRLTERKHYCLVRWEGDIDPRLRVPSELKELNQEFFALRFEDHTRPFYDLADLPEHSLRAEFVREMQELLKQTEDAERRAELELAVWYGLDALTWGRVMPR